MLVIFCVDTLQRLIYTKFYGGNVILFQIEDFARNIKEATLAKYFIKVTARPSFTRLRVIRRINRVN